MENKTNFVGNFNPMRVPTLHGITHLDNLDTTLFPLYITPFVNGVNLIIQHGKIHFLDFKGSFLNTFFKGKYDLLLELSRVNKYTVHCTVHSNGVSNDHLARILADPGRTLPLDLELFISDVVIDKYADKMVANARVGILCAIRKEFKMPGLTTPVPVMAPDLKSLYSDIDSYINHHKYDGVTLWRDKGTYHEGWPEGDYDKVNISLLTKKDFIVAGTTPILADLDGEEVHVTDKLIVHRGSSFIELPVSQTLSTEECRLLELNKEKLYGMTVEIEAIELPSQDLPICRTILRIH